MTNFIFRKQRETGSFYQNTGSPLLVMHPVKFGNENLWIYILSPLMIWEYLGSKDILDGKCIKKRGQERRSPYHEELLKNVSMKYYIFGFLPEFLSE